MSPIAAFLIGLGAGAMLLLLLQAWRAKSQNTQTIGPAVSALETLIGSPSATSAQAWVDSAWLKFVADAKAVIDKEFAAAKVPTPVVPAVPVPPAAGA